MLLSLAVSTYNRSELLKGCLNSIIEQYSPERVFEVLIIDNNSSDNTKPVVESYLKEFTFIKYFIEKNRGVSYARNRAIKEAESDFIAFLDDDAKIGNGFMDKCYKIITEHSPDIFGGPIYPYYLTDKPTWFKDEYETRIHGETGCLKSKYLSASNLIIKKIYLRKSVHLTINSDQREWI